MKKLMIATAIVCAAAFAQAATVNWQIGIINGAGEGGKGWSDEALNSASATAQLIIGTTYSDGVIGGIVGGFDTLTTKAAEEGYMFGSSTSDSMLTDTDYFAQVIIKNGDSTLTSYVGVIQAGAANEGVAEPVFAFNSEMMNITAASGVTFDSTYGTFSSAGWQSVPKPTSGILLLLGMAGLALKRKHA